MSMINDGEISMWEKIKRFFGDILCWIALPFVILALPFVSKYIEDEDYYDDYYEHY